MVYEFMAEKEQQLQVRKRSFIRVENFNYELFYNSNVYDVIFRKAEEEVAVEISVKIIIHVRGIPK